jgi:hypothetical protein
MALVGFEPTISAFERAKKVHASDRAATLIGNISIQNYEIMNLAFNWQDSLGGRGESSRRKAATYTGQHIHRKKHRHIHT